MAKINSLALHATLMMAISAITIYSGQAVAEDSPAIKILLSRAQTQAQSGHLNIAISTWQQVLAADPGNIDALRSIATAEVQLGHQPEANAYIQRLQKAGASKTVIEQLQSMHARPSDATLLQQASAMAKSGQYSGAMQIYQQLYGNDPPAGAMALTYYDTLAALPAERKRAIEGLRKLARQFPSDERYSIALGRVLTYDAITRAEGMTVLQRYPTDRGADDALKQAMLWSERLQTPRDAATAVPNRIAAPQTATTSEVGAGYRALNTGRLSEAEEHFNKALAHEVTHGQAHAGLGYVRMQQKEFSGAVREFEQAKDEGDHDVNLAQSLATSRFWNFMFEAQRALDNKDWESSLASYRSALALKPDNPDALAAVGGTLMRTARPKDAIPYLQRSLRVSAGSQSIWRSLFLAQSQSSQQSDAIKTAERIPANIRTQLETDPEFMGSLAVDYAAIGDQSRSDSVLKRALTLLQTYGEGGPSISNQMQYASLLLTAKRYNTAVRSYRRILTGTPDNSDAWRGMITADHLAGRDDEALRAFRQVPSTISIAILKDPSFLAMLAGIYQSQGQIEAAHTTLERALKIAPSTALKLQLASLEMSDGDKPYATEIYAQIVDEHPESTEAWLGWLQSLHATNHDRDALRQIEEMPENVNSALTQNPDYLQTLASVYGALGDRRRATETIAEVDDFYSQQGIDPPAAVRLQQGWLLLQSGDNAKFSRVIKQLSQTDDLTEDQKSQVARLWASWAIQRASQFSRLGHHTASIEILSAALRAFPNDVSLNNALANAYLANGDPKRAVALYARQDMTQADVSVCVSAINAALTANDRKQAHVWLQTSLDRFGRDSKVLELAARFEQQRGDLQRAAAYDRAALRAAGPPSITELTSNSDVAPGTSEVSSRQELFSLLAPTNAESGAILRAHSRDNLDRDVARDALSTRPDTSHSKGIFAHLKSDSSENDLPLPSLERNTIQGRNKDISRVTSAAPLSNSDQDTDYPVIARKKSTGASTLPPHKHEAIPEQNTISAAADDHSVFDLPDAVTSIPPDSNTSRSRKRLSASPEPINPVLSDIPTFEVHGRTDRQAYDEPSGTIYKNATLKRIVAHNELEDVSTSDAPTSSALLEPGGH